LLCFPKHSQESFSGNCSQSGAPIGLLDYVFGFVVDSPALSTRILRKLSSLWGANSTFVLNALSEGETARKSLDSRGFVNQMTRQCGLGLKIRSGR